MGQTFAVRCPKCEQHVAAIVRGEYQNGGDYEGPVELFMLLECPKCCDPFLAVRHGYCDHPQVEIDFADPKVLYPSDPSILDTAIPANIAASYLEARNVFTQSAANTSAAIMCRRTLEGICKHLGAEGGDLKRKLSDLHKKGLIDDRIHQWADYVLRGLGNYAVHDVDQAISREDAGAALDFTKAIIEYLFVFQAAFDRFKERREKKDEPPDAPGS